MADNFGIADEEFWKNPYKDDDLAGGLPDEGISIAAPTQVAIASRDTFPVVLRRCSSMKDSIAAPTPRYALIHAIDTDRNLQFCDFAMDQDNAIYEEPDPAQLAEVMAGKTMQPIVADLRKRLDLPWRPGPYLVTAFFRDKVSNRRPSDLGGGAGSYQDPAVKEYLEKKKGEVEVPQPSVAGDPLPAFKKIEGSPEAPKKPGIVISGERVVELRKDAKCVVKGALTATLRPEEIVKDKEREEKAVVSLHLLVFSADDATPALRTLRLPVYGAAAAGKPATAHFAFDLLSLVDVPQKTQTYFLYAFSRDLMSTAQPFAFIGKDTLPPGAT